MYIRIIILLFILLIIDLYVFNGIRFLSKHLQLNVAAFIHVLFWTVTAVSFVFIISGLFYDWRLWPKSIRTYSFAFIFITYFSKLFLVLFLVMDDLFRVARWTAEAIGIVQPDPSPGTNSTEGDGITRSGFLVRLGVILAAIPFTALVLGMMKGKYEYQVRKINLTLKKLPNSFHGFKIVQISDLHTGSFTDVLPIEKAVGMINDLNPDLIVFTGDLVNDLHSEVLPYVEALSKLKAKHGVISILGNHDYGDYYQWKNREDKSANLKALKKVHSEMGWDLLLDEFRHIEKNGEKISVIGVQNWSARMNFTRYGDLNRAIENIEFSPVNILLSHDPSHWKAEVSGKVKEIDLTLSGHTHGFQFGVDIPGFKWSPVQYVYREWADLYTENDQHLYVNRGLGFIGYPGRVGVLPEITFFQLEGDVTI